MAPHAAELVGTLVESLSELEPQSLNYMSFHVDKYDVSRDLFDEGRVAVTQSSPTMEAIRLVLNAMDASSMQTLVPRLIDVVRRGVGLPTRIGCATCLVILASQHPELVRPHADALVQALTGTVQDPNASVRRAFGMAIGQLSPLLSSTGKLGRVISHLAKTYEAAVGDSAVRITLAQTMRSIGRLARDSFLACAGEAVPFVYLGTFESDKDVRGFWADVWESLPATSLLQAHRVVVLARAEHLLRSSSWPQKTQAAAALAALSQKEGMFDSEEAFRKTWAALLESLGSRLWAGKESVLLSLVTVAVSVPVNYVDRAALGQLILRELRSTDKNYRRHVLEGLCLLAEKMDLQLYASVEPLLRSIVEEAATVTASPSNLDEDGAKERPLALLVEASAIRALALCFPNTPSTTSDLEPLLRYLLERVPKSIWNVRLACLDAVQVLMTKSASLVFLGEDLLREISDCAFTCALDVKYSAVRVVGLKTLVKLVSLAKPLIPSLRTVILDKLQNLPQLQDPDYLSQRAELKSLLESG